jgi:ABC-type multidrug transport system fused ATPase/permease subunit
MTNPYLGVATWVTGRISIDDRDIRNITLDSLRKHIGLVQQDVYLFAGTVLDNIRYGNLESTAGFPKKSFYSYF